MDINFDREKYITIAKTKGLSQAISQIHNDIWEVEYKCFENENGYDPQVWKTLTSMRLFSREIWDLKLKPTSEW